MYKVLMSRAGNSGSPVVIIRDITRSHRTAHTEMLGNFVRYLAKCCIARTDRTILNGSQYAQRSQMLIGETLCSVQIVQQI